MSKYDRWRASKNIFEIVPHDTDEILTDSIRAPSDGVITFRALDDSVDVSHPVRAGEIIPVRTRYIRASGTTVNGSILAYAVSHKDYTQYTNLTPDIINGVSNVIQPSTATALNQFGFVASPGVRTNLSYPSQEFNNAGWGKTGGSTVSANTAIAPNGTLTADTWSRATTGSNFMTKLVVKPGIPQTLTFSIFVKKGSARYFSMRMQGLYPARSDVTFDLDTGLVSRGPAVNTFTNVSASITPLANGWYHCTLTSTTDSDTSCQTLVSFSTSNVEIDGSSASAVADGYLWGSQLELGNKATAYIPTTTTAVTSTLPRFEYDMGEPIVGASRTNLCLRSKEFNDSGAWIVGIASVTANAGVSPDGSNTADKVTISGQYGNVRQLDLVKTPGATVSVSVWIKSLSGNTNLSLRGNIPGVVYLQPITITNDWVRYSATFVYNGTNGIGIEIQDRNPSGWGEFLVWGAQVEVGSTATQYIPTYASAVTTNLTYNPVVRGLLLEPARTNLCVHSENPADATWVPSAVLKSSTTSPDPFGTNKAALIAATSGSASHYVLTGNSTITYELGKDYTFSVFVKPGSQNIIQVTGAAAIFGAGYFNIDIQNCVVGGGFGGVARVVKLADGWCRVSLTMTATGSGLSHAGGLAIVPSLDSTRLQANPLTTNLYIAGWQLEQASEPSSYIPTTTAAVTRPADILNLTGLNKANSRYTARCWHSDSSYTDVPNITVTNGAASIIGVSVKPIQTITFI